MSIAERLQEFIENEARSCSMDFGCVTPLYVYRCWGGAIALEEIEELLKRISQFVNQQNVSQSKLYDKMITAHL